MEIRTKKQRIQIIKIIVGLIIIIVFGVMIQNRFIKQNPLDKNSLPLDNNNLSSEENDLPKENLLIDSTIDIYNSESLSTNELLIDSIESNQNNSLTNLSSVKEVSVDNLINKLIYFEDALIYFYRFDKKELTVEQKAYINQSIMALIRNEKYSDRGFDRMSLMWGLLAGETPPEIVSLIDELGLESVDTIANSLEYNELLVSSKSIMDIEILFGRKINSSEKIETDMSYIIDFQHMMATLNCLTNDIEMKDESELFYDSLTGWGGDLLTFYHDLNDYNQMNKDSNIDKKNQFINDTLGTTRDSFFNELDLNADIDAVNLSELIVTHNLLLSEAFLWYYDSGIKDRIIDFIEYYGGEKSFKELVFLFVNFNSVTQNDIRLHSIEAEELSGILLMFQNELNIDIPTEQDKKSLYTAFIHKLNLD